MFELKKQDLKIKSLNTRTETHGPDIKPACDLMVTWTTKNTALDLFDANLKEHFFKKDPENDGDLADQGESYTLMRFSECSGIKWDYKGAGYRMLIHIGVSGDDNILVADVKVDKFSFSFKKGGMVDIDFKISCTPVKTVAGELFDIQGQVVTMDLEPPEEGANMGMFEDSDDDVAFVA